MNATVAQTRRATDTASRYAATGLLIRLALRQSRALYVTWIAALTLTTVATVLAYERVVPPGANAELTMAALGGNPTMRAMLGPPFDLMNPGGFTMWRVGTFVAAALAWMAAFGVIRATRAEEEDGRLELLRAGAVGRRAPLTAAVLVAAAACLCTGVFIAVSLTAAAPPARSALAVGLGIALVGLVGAGIGAVTAQVSESARGARGLASAALGAAYLMRAVADGSAEASGLRPLAWLSPLEWAALARPYAAERWWVLVLPLALAVSLVWLGFRLESVRDHGAGLRSAGQGPARGAAGLSGVVGLAVRLHRSSLIGWAAGVAVFAVAMGSLSDAFSTMVSDLPELAEIFRRMGGGAQDLREAFYVAMLGLIVIVLAMLGVQVLGTLRREEERGHAELLLSTAVPRRGLALSHIVPAIAAPTVLMAICGALLGLNEALGAGSVEPMGRVAWAGLVLTPGVWVCVGVAMVLHGWLPQHAGLAWALVGWSLFVAWIGAVLGLPDWLRSATPFAALPTLPVESMDWIAVLLHTALAVVFVAVGLAGYRRRNIGGG
ncbi:MAG: ABC transporter permease [Actinomycetales bacterium]|nr:ABC transporter permease [Actinomycetales bacterium]